MNALEDRIAAGLKSAAAAQPDMLIDLEPQASSRNKPRAFGPILVSLLGVVAAIIIPLVLIGLGVLSTGPAGPDVGVATGSPSVPDVVGQLALPAVRDLQAAGFGAFTFEGKWSDQPIGTVLSQDLVPGTSSDPRTQVQLVVSVGPKRQTQGVLIGLGTCDLRPPTATAACAGGPVILRPPFTTQTADHRGSLSPEEVLLATSIAKQQQAKVTGTFVGATAFLSQGTPFAATPECAGGEGLITIRLVWEADANFAHAGAPSMPPDGPRKALLVTFEEATSQVCSIGAMYREVGAKDTETLLYGQWPDPADS